MHPNTLEVNSRKSVKKRWIYEGAAELWRCVWSLFQMLWSAFCFSVPWSSPQDEKMTTALVQIHLFRFIFFLVSVLP